MRLIRADKGGTVYINADRVELLEITYNGKYAAYTSASNRYYISKEAFDNMLKYGKADDQTGS